MKGRAFHPQSDVYKKQEHIHRQNQPRSTRIKEEKKNEKMKKL